MGIRNFLIIISAVIFLISCSGNEKGGGENYKEITIQENSTIVCFGNSLTQGYGAGNPIDENKAYPHHLAGKVNVPVVNLGISGETSEDALERIGDVLSNNPAVIIIEFGANDLFEQMDQAMKLRPVDSNFVDNVERNFEEILKELTDENRQIYLVKFYNKQMAEELLKGRIEYFAYDYMFVYDNYEKMFSRLKNKYGVSLISNIWDGIWGNDELMYEYDYYGDYEIKIHPNAAGYEIMADNIFKSIKGFLEFNDLLSDL